MQTHPPPQPCNISTNHSSLGVSIINVLFGLQQIIRYHRLLELHLNIKVSRDEDYIESFTFPCIVVSHMPVSTLLLDVT